MVGSGCRIRLLAEPVLIHYIVELKIRTVLQRRMLKLSEPRYLATGLPTHQNSPRLIAYLPKLYCREERWHCGSFVVVRSYPHTTTAFPEVTTYSFFKV